MNRSVRWISTALAVVLLTSLTSKVLSDEPLLSEELQTSLFGVDEGPETLTVMDKEPLPLKFGNSVELHRFDLDAGFPYTLRYLSFEVDSQDLSITDWSVYEVEKGKINYSEKVGQGEHWGDGLIKLRFFSDRSRGYFGEGKQSFSIVADVIRNGDNPELSLKQANPEDLSDFYHWAWMEGHQDSPWSEL